MSDNSTLTTLLDAGKDDAVALAAPGRESITFSSLRSSVSRTAESLRRFGIQRSDTAAIVLPNGPELASAFLGVATAAVAAPLNPAYTEEEFEFYLSDLAATSLIIERDGPSPARIAAGRLGIPIIDLVPGERCGTFELESATSVSPASSGSPAGDPRPGDVALVLHTSGTTSRPKIVPLTHANISASARNIRTALRLTGDDVCLNIMPLFHIHGLMAAVVASLAAGASVYCTPGFDALRFFRWMKQAEPTWYTAVPTMHQAILMRMPHNREVARGSRLRFIRSSSASLPPRIMRELEESFEAPVVESYGMTEATHQMTSNPLPPGTRKPGSVGVAAGPEVCVMDLNGNLVPPGCIGEVAIRGASVTAGYRNNPAATAAVLAGDWFRTGDQGVIDRDGYLTLTGRLKELINRGGEKISPREVDEVLLDHPEVAHALAFAIPHRTLGEEVAAVVVLRARATATERELQDHVAGHLASFKVPRRIIFLRELPKGPTGKPQRIGLARRLGLGDPANGIHELDTLARVDFGSPPTSEASQPAAEIESARPTWHIRPPTQSTK